MISRSQIKTFIIFQYSNGIGHLTRCSALAQALSTFSHVTMFSGGRPVDGYSAPPGVDFIQLPAISWERVAGSFPVPVDPGDTLAEVEHMRGKLLVDSYLRIKPKIIVVEYFPFAPRRFGRTLDDLFDVIKKDKEKPTVVCSIRAYPKLWDNDADPAWINEQLRENFSCVLHHADSKLFPLTSLGPYMQSALSGISVSQTGFVRRPLVQKNRGRPSTGLLLTVGGGALDADLLKLWINAARAGSPDLFPINVVCGPMMNAKDRKMVFAEQEANISVHDWVADLDELISSSRAVVCTGGYNTLVETLSLAKPVLAFPNSDLGDQVFQVNALHSQGMLLMGTRSQSKYEITALMNKLLQFRPQHQIDCRGAGRSVEIVKHLLGASLLL